MTKRYIKADLNEFPKLKCLTKHLVCKDSVIAGGCFKNLFEDRKPKDLDVFFLSEKAKQDYNAFLTKQAVKKLHESDKDKTFDFSNQKVDVIDMTYGSVKQILKTFDFTIVKFALYCSKWSDDEEDRKYEVMFHHQYFEHLMQKKLVIDEPLQWPLSTFDRFCRYMHYGYKPCMKTKQKLLFQITDSLAPASDDSETADYIKKKIEKEIRLGMYGGGID